MRWPIKPYDRWKRRFALFPVTVSGDMWLWFEWYLVRSHGDYIERIPAATADEPEGK